MQSVAIENYQNPETQPMAQALRRTPAVHEDDPLGVRDDAALGARWFTLKSDAPVSITQEVLTSFWDKGAILETEIRQDLAAGRDPRTRFIVFASERPGVFNLGGDLKFFKDCIEEGNRDALKCYAKACIDYVHATVTGFQLPLTTIALVQGNAQGGGFEGALSHNVIVAERQAKMGFPEVLFNMFPGMGAYHLLCRRVAPVMAERLIVSGKTYSAEELYDMGIVDVLADDGKGEDAVMDYIKKADARRNGRDALRRVICETDPVRYEDLTKSIDVWVDAAFNLDESDLKMMDYLIRAQQRMSY